MRRDQLEHVLRAASQIADSPDAVIIGSRSGQPCPRAACRWKPPLPWQVDVAFFDGSDHQKSDRVDGAIGELSPFHEMYGCYAAFAPRRCLKGGAAPGA